MVKMLIGITAVALAVAGCSPAAPWHASWHSGWSKPDMTGEAFEQDVRACDRTAMQVAGGDPGHRGSATAGATVSAIGFLGGSGGPVAAAAVDVAQHADVIGHDAIHAKIK